MAINTLEPLRKNPWANLGLVSFGTALQQIKSIPIHFDPGLIRSVVFCFFFQSLLGDSPTSILSGLPRTAKSHGGPLPEDPVKWEHWKSSSFSDSLFPDYFHLTKELLITRKQKMFYMQAEQFQENLFIYFMSWESNKNCAEKSSMQDCASAWNQKLVFWKFLERVVMCTVVPNRSIQVQADCSVVKWLSVELDSHTTNF